MESMNLIVADKSPELAERINSLLRNSGIRIHVIHAIKAIEVKKALDQAAPLCIVYAQPEPTTASIEEISTLARDYAVPFALYTDMANSSELIETLKSTVCLVIYSEDENQQNKLRDSEMRLLKEQLDKEGIQHTVEFKISKDISGDVLKQSADSDLIVVTSTLDYEIKDFFVGPYAQRIVNHAKVPVLNIRPELFNL